MDERRFLSRGGWPGRNAAATTVQRQQETGYGRFGCAACKIVVLFRDLYISVYNPVAGAIAAEAILVLLAGGGCGWWSEKWDHCCSGGCEGKSTVNRGLTEADGDTRDGSYGVDYLLWVDATLLSVYSYSEVWKETTIAMGV